MYLKAKVDADVEEKNAQREIRRRIDTPTWEENEESLYAHLDQRSSRHLFSVAFASSLDGLPHEIPRRGNGHDAPRSFRSVLDEYTAGRRNELDRGDIAVSTYKETCDCLEDFALGCDKYGVTSIDDVDEDLVRLYQSHTKTLPPYRKRIKRGKKIVISEAPISRSTAGRRLRHLNVFMEWAYENGMVKVLPRNVNQRNARMKGTVVEPTHCSLDEVQELFAVANEKSKFSRTKSRRPALYMALALNCGYGQTDISALRHSDLDWDSEWGVVIRRKRNKTKTPQVHKLWRLTVELLKEEMIDPNESDRVLLSEDGGPLEVEDPDKKIWKTNRVGRSYDRVKRKLIQRGKTNWEAPRKGIAILRKTSADLLKNQYPSMPHIYRQFLGRSTTGDPETRVDRHYVKEHYEGLFAALVWLETYYDLDGKMRTDVLP